MEIGPGVIAVLALATFAGALVQAASGFGFAILAAPIYLAATGSTAAIPLLVLLHVIQSAMLVPAIWREAPPEVLRRLLIGGALGCPLGLLLFLFANVRMLKIAVGVLILGVTALIIARERGWIGAGPAPAGGSAAAKATASGAGAGTTGADTTGAGGAAGPEGERAWPATTTGVVSGAMTSLLVMPGPPLMVWLMGSPLGKVQARALSLTFFAVCYVAVSLLNIAAGQVGRTTWAIAIVLAPTVVLGTMAGTRIVGHISEIWFRRVVLALLALSGIGAVVSALI